MNYYKKYIKMIQNYPQDGGEPLTSNYKNKFDSLYSIYFYKKSPVISLAEIHTPSTHIYANQNCPRYTVNNFQKMILLTGNFKDRKCIISTNPLKRTINVSCLDMSFIRAIVGCFGGGRVGPSGEIAWVI